MGERGPSPLIPLLLVGVLAMVIFGPFLLCLWETVIMPLLELGSILAILILLLVLLVHLNSTLFPKLGAGIGMSMSSFSSVSASAPSDDDGFGLGMGSFLLLLLFLLLYRLF
ncbi:hypothetical protein CsatA_030359 [Cannabis sativa]